jgi:light-regulated signal transduction histidine kinase (bacteriophytochrome)
MSHSHSFVPPSIPSSVRPSGIGISDIDIKRLKVYKLFNKLRSFETDNLNPGGTGLGLAICNKLAQKLGGTFNFDSIKDEGENSLHIYTVRTACTYTQSHRYCMGTIMQLPEMASLASHL